MKMTLKAIRVNKNWTQKEMAEMLGVSKETIQNYESGKTYPTYKTISKIVSLTGIKYDDIIFLTK